VHYHRIVRLANISRLHVPNEALSHTQQVLRRYGDHGCEGLVLWVGTVDETEAHITRVVVPDQNPIKSESGVGYFVKQPALFQLAQFLRKEKLRLIAQVHSHPTDAYHSETDDRYAIVTEDGGFSLVVPDFARRAMTLEECAIYRLMRGSWIELSEAIVRDVFLVS
jgi:proteasome lid subunit RPN8/RPN11